MELLTWISARPRTYREALEAWGSNCPRHAVWEDAVVDRLVQVVRGTAGATQARVTLTARGTAVLDEGGNVAGRETMTRYLDTLVQRGDYGRFFAEDARFSIEGTDQSGTGRDAVEHTIRFLHEVAFDASPELKNLIVEGNKAAIEADFVGVHTGEFAGLPPSGRSVRVPYSVVYDLEGDTITSLRIYMPMQALLEQLSGTPAPAEAAAT
jgi:predicted ester cyclase